MVFTRNHWAATKAKLKRIQKVWQDARLVRQVEIKQEMKEEGIVVADALKPKLGPKWR